MQVVENYVLGQWQRGESGMRPLHNPTTGEEIAQAGTGGVDMKAVLAYARDVGGPALRAMTFAQRGEMLMACSKAIYAEREALIDVALQNSGNTRKDAKFDIDGATGTLAAYAYYAKELGDTQVMLDGDGVALGRTPRFWGQHALLPLHLRALSQALLHGMLPRRVVVCVSGLGGLHALPEEGPLLGLAPLDDVAADFRLLRRTRSVAGRGEGEGEGGREGERGQ